MKHKGKKCDLTERNYFRKSPENDWHGVTTEKIEKSFRNKVVTNETFECQNEFVILSQHIETRQNSCGGRTVGFRTTFITARSISIYFNVLLE